MEFTQEVRKATDPIYQKISKVMPEIEWSVHAPYIHKINKLKKEKNAVILAHNYQTPEIYHGVADFSADSLALAIEASKTSADIILMAGVHFMAETAKLMSPNKKVILPDMDAGCSLSSSITGKDVRLLKEKYPGVPVVSYVNTSAEVKAETDVCCTSANAVKIVKSLGVKRVIFLPDDYLAKYVASQTDVEIISWKGICIVHDQFNKKEIEDIRKNNPGIKIIAHPECPPDVIEASDFAGSTVRSTSTPSRGMAFGDDSNALRRFFCMYRRKECAVENSLSDICIGKIPVESTASNLTEVVSAALFITHRGRYVG